MDSEAIEAKVKQIIMEKLNVEESEIVPSANFIEDLRAGRNERLAYGVDTLPWGFARRQVSCAGSSNRFGSGADWGEAPIGERRLGGYRGTCAVFSAPACARGCRLLVIVSCSAFSKPAFSR